MPRGIVVVAVAGTTMPVDDCIHPGLLGPLPPVELVIELGPELGLGLHIAVVAILVVGGDIRPTREINK